MRKLTVIAALLGSVYFANAQVGIGTPDPALSAELDIVSKDKGILIPRVKLTDINVYAPITGTEQQSLLVYNLTQDADPAKDLVVGFYYWENAKWNRVVNKEELDEVVNNIGGDITNITNNVKSIQDVINYILPSNPGNDEKDPSKWEKHTTIVYNQETKTFQEVTYENGTYVTHEIDLSEIIYGFETPTVILPVEDENGKVTGYMYFNEFAMRAFLDARPGATYKDITTDDIGGFLIDVKGDVVNNIKEILESKTEIIVDGITFTTVEEYLQYITQFSEGNVIYQEITNADGSTEWVFQYWDGTKYVTIDIESTVIEIINQNIENIKNILGDKITVGGDTIINTGDTINGEFVFKFMGETVVGTAGNVAPSARTSGLKLPAGSNATGLVAITLLDANKNVVATNVTNVGLSADQIDFNLGTGNHYTTLPQGTYSVIVEFTSSNKPVTPQP